MAKGRRAIATFDWRESDASFVEVLARVTNMFERFERIARFRFAAKDMELAAHAAAALIDAHENDGPARLYDRVIETGMVVTYVRPFLESNEAGIGRKWRPTEEVDREIHNELVDLRHEYHAHAAHTPRRSLQDVSQIVAVEGRPVFSEVWEHLPTSKLRALEDLATRQAERFQAEATRLDLELFGEAER